MSDIPWLHRHRIGTLHAYWRTINWVVRRPRWLAVQAIAPVSSADAHRFRWATVMWLSAAWVVLGTGFEVLRKNSDSLSGTIRDFSRQYAETGLSAALLMAYYTAIFIAPILSYIALTGLPSYFHHPGSIPVRQQNRAVALSHYACAPLAWLPVSMVLSVFAALNQPDDEEVARVLAILSLATAGIIFTVWWRGCLVLMARTTSASRARRVVVALLLPVLALLAMLLPLALPLLTGIVVLVFGSLA